MKIMKQSIITTGGKYSTARMLVDYVQELYMPLCNLHNKYFRNLESVTQYEAWKRKIEKTWNNIIITQENNADNITIDAGNCIEVKCKVKLPNIDKENICVQVYYGQINENGTVENILVVPMKLVESEEKEKIYTYTAKVELKTGGNYGYTFRVMPKHEMLLDSENLDLVKWIMSD